MVTDSYDISLRKNGTRGEISENYTSGRKVTISFSKLRKRLILLVHGFNVKYDDAQKIYSSFVTRICETSRFVKQDDIWLVHWPGEGTSQGLGLISNGLNALSYPQQVENAKKSGSLLYQFLFDYITEGNNSIEELILIGHSLGCRVILEALKKLSGSSSILKDKQIKICLMAAAVPSALIELSSLRQYPQLELWSAINLASYKFILFSDTDEALGLIFDKGQQIAKEPGEAVGLKGKPINNIWNYRQQMENFRHRDYWQDKNGEVIKTILEQTQIVTSSILPRNINSRTISNRSIESL